MNNKNDIKSWVTIAVTGITCYQAKVEIKGFIESLFGDTYVLAVTNPDKKPHRVKVTMCDRPYFRIEGYRYFLDEIIRL